MSAGMTRKKILCGTICLLLLNPVQLWSKAPKIINHVGGDVTENFTSWPLLVLIGGGALAGGLTQSDQKMNRSLNPANQRETMNSVLGVAGAPYVIDSAAATTFMTGYFLHQPELAKTGEVLLETLFLTESSTLALKVAVRRTRPDGGNYSFPSGHASRSFAVATALTTLHGPVAAVPSYLIAGLISFSRLDSHAHYLSDVVFGSALGASIGWATARFHQRTGNFLIAPLVGDQQAGLLVSGNF